jgi:hypothetical protein
MSKPKYIANAGKPWASKEVVELKKLGGRVPTRVIALKLQRPVGGIRAKAEEIKMSLRPVNRSPRSKLK